MVKTQQGTTDDWKQWQSEFAPDPEELRTRAEILETAERLGARRPDGQPVDDRTLRFWGENGIIPRGVEGKIQGRNYTYRLYPWWVVDLIYQVCCYQKAHIRLEDLPARMRLEAQHLSLSTAFVRPKDPQQYGDRLSFKSFIFRTLREPTLPPFARQLFSIGEIQSQLADLLYAFAQSLHTEGLDRAERARVQFFDGEGAELVTYEADFRYHPHQLSPEQQKSLDQRKADTAATVASLTGSGTSKE